MSKKINKWVLICIILAVLLVSLLVYIGIKSYKEARENEKNEIFLQGAQYGYQSAVANLMQSGVNCTPVNVYIQNETMQFVDVSCLNV
jgi:flagellar basal body-associated protein FliL